MKIKNLDNLVLTVTDITKSVSFYENVLGMKAINFGENRIALKFGYQKINLHQSGHEYEPKAENVQIGSSDLCFIIEAGLTEAIQHVRKQGVLIIEGPVKRTGALVPIKSFYFRDPDGNLIEISSY